MFYKSKVTLAYLQKKSPVVRGTLCGFKIVLFLVRSLKVQKPFVWFIGPGFKNRPSLDFKWLSPWFIGYRITVGSAMIQLLPFKKREKHGFVLKIHAYIGQL